jgi:hypothetical protein
LGFVALGHAPQPPTPNPQSPIPNPQSPFNKNISKLRIKLKLNKLI